MATELIYLSDFGLTEAEGVVTARGEEEGRAFLLLDRTVFYPQGGGQPADRGIITGPGGEFKVVDVRFREGEVYHFGERTHGEISSGQKVSMDVERARRKLHSRLHSAGHLVDMAVADLGFNWTPGKGYHFPDGSYVEYEGDMGSADKDWLKHSMEAKLARYIGQDTQTKLLFMNREEMAKVCRHVPDNLPEGKPGRVVMYGDFAVPCGGTHVGNLMDIGAVTIRKIKAAGGKIKVGYAIEH